MFCLVIGRAPFECAHEKDTRWPYISTGNFTGLFEYLSVPTPSANALDLLKSLLTTADKRLDVAAVLKHAWCTEEIA